MHAYYRFDTFLWSINICEYLNIAPILLILLSYHIDNKLDRKLDIKTIIHDDS